MVVVVNEIKNNDNDILTCTFDFYRTNRFGINERFDKLELKKRQNN